MRKTSIVLLAAFVFACNNNTDQSTDTTTKSDTAQTGTAAATSDEGVPKGLTREEYDKAISLIANSDCLTCHQIEQKTTGPAYKEVALKYEATEANITMLADKIIKGGVGVWGQVPMTPHDSLSVEDAKTMAKYILALKN